MNDLTARQTAVLELKAAGATLEEIADQLDISVSTAELHLRNAVEKMGAKNSTHAAVEYAKRQFLDEQIEKLQLEISSDIIALQVAGHNNLDEFTDEELEIFNQRRAIAIQNAWDKLNDS